MEDKLQSIDITQLPKASEVKSDDIMLLVRKNADGTVTPMKVDGSVLPSGGNGGASTRKKIKERYVLGRAIKPFSCQMGNESNWYVYSSRTTVIPINFKKIITADIYNGEKDFLLKVYFNSPNGYNYGVSEYHNLRGISDCLFDSDDQGRITLRFGFTYESWAGYVVGLIETPSFIDVNFGFSAYRVESITIDDGIDHPGSKTVELRLIYKNIYDNEFKSDSLNLIAFRGRIMLNPMRFNKRRMCDLIRREFQHAASDESERYITCSRRYGILGKKQKCRDFRRWKRSEKDGRFPQKQYLCLNARKSDGLALLNGGSGLSSTALGKYQFAFYDKNVGVRRRSEWFNFFLCKRDTGANYCI